MEVICVIEEIEENEEMCFHIVFSTECSLVSFLNLSIEFFYF